MNVFVEGEVDETFYVEGMLRWAKRRAKVRPTGPAPEMRTGVLGRLEAVALEEFVRTAVRWKRGRVLTIARRTIAGWFIIGNKRTPVTKIRRFFVGCVSAELVVL